jgi:bidirectional [NiFe] hydrogenase diaphorase subunit
MENVELVINGKNVKVKEGSSILQAACQVGIDIPTLCYLEKLSPFGACRLCTVEISRNNRKRLVASCAYPAENNLVVETDSERVIKTRRMILELLWPRCQSGPIEALAKKYGLKKSRFTAENTACALCGLCVRYCTEIKKANAIGFTGRGVEREVTFMPEVASRVCPGCRECFELCPGGKVITESLDGSWFPPLLLRK